LDVKTDSFFELHACDLFPDAISANEEELKLVTKKEQEIRKSSSNPHAGNHHVSNPQPSSKELVAAIDTLPALVEKKKSLEVHTNIFHATFEAVSSRHVHEYSMLEQRLMDGVNHASVKADVLALLSDSTKVSIYLPTYLSIYLSIHLSIYLFIYLSIYLSIFIYIYILSGNLFVQ
jgi:hypothetical protein